MSWLAAFVFELAAFGAAAVVGVLTTAIPTRSDYTTLLTDGMRGVGLVITVAGFVLGTVILAYALVAIVG